MAVPQIAKPLGHETDINKNSFHLPSGVRLYDGRITTANATSGFSAQIVAGLKRAARDPTGWHSCAQPLTLARLPPQATRSCAPRAGPALHTPWRPAGRRAPRHTGRGMPRARARAEGRPRSTTNAGPAKAARAGCRDRAKPPARADTARPKWVKVVRCPAPREEPMFHR